MLSKTKWKYILVPDDICDKSSFIGVYDVIKRKNYTEKKILSFTDYDSDNGKKVCFRTEDSNGTYGFALSKEIRLLRDTTPPTFSLSLDPSSDSGTQGDNITNDTTPTINISNISGTISTGQVKIKLRTNTYVIEDNYIDFDFSSGSYTSPYYSVIGDYTFTFKLTDNEGNTTEKSITITLL